MPEERGDETPIILYLPHPTPTKYFVYHGKCQLQRSSTSWPFQPFQPFWERPVLDRLLWRTAHIRNGHFGNAHTGNGPFGNGPYGKRPFWERTLWKTAIMGNGHFGKDPFGNCPNENI